MARAGGVELTQIHSPDKSMVMPESENCSEASAVYFIGLWVKETGTVSNHGSVPDCVIALAH